MAMTSDSLASSACTVPSVSRVLSKRSADPSTTTIPTRSSVWRSAERAYCAPLQPYPTHATGLPFHSA